MALFRRTPKELKALQRDLNNLVESVAESRKAMSTRAGGGFSAANDSITAAATVVKADDEDERNRIRRGPAAWQREAARTYDDLVEIHYPANYVGNAMGRLQLGAAVRPDPRQPPVLLDPNGEDDFGTETGPDGLPIVTDEEREVIDATVNRLHENSAVPMHEMQRHFGLNIFVTGECNLVGYEDDDNGEVWEAISAEELVINPSGKGYARRMSYEGGPLRVVPMPPDAYIARIWQRHWRYSSWPDSAMRPVLNLCQALRNLTDSIEAASESRLSAGILLLTHGFLSATPDQTMVGNPDEENVMNPTIRSLVEHFETPPQQPRSASRWVPYLLWGEREDVQAAKLLNPMRDVDKEAVAQRMELRKEIAVGLDLPPEVLSGAADVNHWNLFQVSEDVWKYHLEGFGQVMCNGLTIGYLRPQLQLANRVNGNGGGSSPAINPDRLGRFFIWYDPTDLLIHPNREQQYQDAYDRYEVSGAAYRRSKGIPDSDAPEAQEKADRVYWDLLKRFRAAPGPVPTPTQILNADFPTPVQEAVAGANPQATPALPPAPGAAQPSAAPAPAPEPSNAAPAAAPPATNPPTAAPATKPPSQRPMALPPVRQLALDSGKGTLGRQLAAMEMRLRGRLLEAVDASARRALERTGNRLRSLSNRNAEFRALVNDVPAAEVAVTLGQERVEQLVQSPTDLLQEAFAVDELRTKWDSLVSRTNAQATAAVLDASPVSDDELDATRLDHLDSVRDAAMVAGFATLTGGTFGYLASKLYKPYDEAPALGEYDSQSIIPMSLIRDALLTAGGGRDPDGTGGLLSGQNMSQLLDATGMEVKQYTWTTGDPDHPFPPHHDLDGETFAEGWEDDVRLADSPFGDYLYPGDHDGCQCTWQEDIVPADQADPNMTADDLGLDQLSHDDG